MIKILLGNALFGGCVLAWFVYAEWERSLMLSGTILAFGCFLSGIFMGYILRGPGKRRRVVYGGSGQAGDADPVMGDDGAQEQAESEQMSDASEAVVEPGHHEEPDRHEVPIAVPIAFVASVVEPAAPAAPVASALEPAPVGARV